MSQQYCESKQIVEHKYEVFPLPPMVSHNLLIDVSKMIGPSLGPLFDRFTGKNVDEILKTKLDSDFLTKAFDSFFANVNKETIEIVIKALREKTMVDGKELHKIFDIHFLGNLDEMYQWLFFAMKVQWGKLFSALTNSISFQGAETPAIPE